MHIKQRLAGRYKCLVSKEGCSPHKETDWFDNLITNQGLDSIGNADGFGQPFATPSICGFVGVGTGSATPSTTDTTLDAFLASYPTFASPGTGITVANSYIAGSPAYYKCLFTYNFAVGAAAGNLTELGTGYYNSGNSTFKVFSRALIVDGGGSPTTLTILSDEILTVVYELRCYLDQTDNTYSILINGTDTYGGTYRLAQIATAPTLDHAQKLEGSIPGVSVYNGTIGAITGLPSGTLATGSSSSAGYTNGNYYVDMTTSFSVSQANLSGGISAATVTSWHGVYQFEVSPAIPKDNTKIMSLTFRLSWARYP